MCNNKNSDIVTLAAATGLNAYCTSVNKPNALLMLCIAGTASTSTKSGLLSSSSPPLRSGVLMQWRSGQREVSRSDMHQFRSWPIKPSMCDPPGFRNRLGDIGSDLEGIERPPSA